jgi:hypothetical protein
MFFQAVEKWQIELRKWAALKFWMVKKRAKEGK